MADLALLFFLEGLKKGKKNTSATLYALSLDVMLDKQEGRGELTDRRESLWLTLPLSVCVCVRTCNLAQQEDSLNPLDLSLLSHIGDDWANHLSVLWVRHSARLPALARSQH